MAIIDSPYNPASKTDEALPDELFARIRGTVLLECPAAMDRQS